MYQHFLEGIDFGSELPNDLGVGVLIHHGAVDDLLRTVRVPQGRQGLLDRYIDR